MADVQVHGVISAGIPAKPYLRTTIAKVTRDDKGHIVYNKATARQYRRAFVGRFGREKKDLIEIMSK